MERLRKVTPQTFFKKTVPFDDRSPPRGDRKIINFRSERKERKFHVQQQTRVYRYHPVLEDPGGAL